MAAAKTLDVRFISGKDQLADILTKPLAAARFILKSNLNVQLPTSSLRGRIRSHDSSTNDKAKVLELDQEAFSLDKQ
jgi:hypothetical protein